MTPEEIDKLFESHGLIPGSEGGGAADGDGDDDDAGSDSEQTRITAGLAAILLDAQSAWVSGSEDLDLIAQKLGDGSRDESWRVPIGEAGLLDFFLNIVAVEGIRQPLRIHALRLIGNSCADTDENRARLVASNRLSSIISLLSEDSTLAFVIPVIYNILLDYEPAQLQACQAALSNRLVDIISGPRLHQCRDFLNFICKILSLLASQEPELQLANPATPAVLLNLATSRTYPPDLEDFCGLISAALSYLSTERLQDHLLSTGGGFSLLQQAFYNSCSQYGIGTIDSDEANQLKDLWTAFVQIFADISSLSSFPRICRLGSPEAKRLVAWLGSPASYTHIQTAACLALGNLARSDEASIALLKYVQGPLVGILSRAVPITPSPGGYAQPAQTPSQLTHAALSFLKNLAIPAANKEKLGQLLEPPTQAILPRLWTSTDTQTQTQFAAVSLARLLLLGCPANVRRLCAPLSSDTSSPAHERSNLHVLVDLFSRVDTEPTKMEAARAVATVCRVLHSGPVLAEGNDGQSPTWQPNTPSGSEATSTNSPGTVPAVSAPENPFVMPRTPRAALYASHTEISTPLSFLVMQKRFPALRSEAWFVFALMARSPEGARIVVQAIDPVESCRALVEAVTGKDMFDGSDLSTPTSAVTGALLPAEAPDTGAGGGMEANAIDSLGLQPQQVDPKALSMARIDRENGLVLITELMKHYSDALPSPRRFIFGQLLITGGELVLHQRQQDKDMGDAPPP